MLRESIKSAIETIKRIHSELLQDQKLITQTIGSLQMENFGVEESLFRNGTEPDNSPTAKDTIQTFGSEVVSTGCDEEIKFSIIDEAKTLNIKKEKSPMKGEQPISDFFRIQKKTIAELNEENKKLRDELDELQREKNISKIETMKEIGQELAKGIDKERDELKQQLAKAYEKIEELKIKAKEDKLTKEKTVEHILKENKKMKEYIDTLIRTRADSLKVVALERMLNDMVLQLSKLGEKCSYQQTELDKKEQEAQEVQKRMEKLERENRSYTATIKYVTAKLELYNKGNEKRIIKVKDKPKEIYDVLPRTKIVKPIKGGAPAIIPKHTKNPSIVPKLKLDSLIQGDSFSRASATERSSSGFIHKTSMDEIKSKMYEQNLRKFDMLVETQKVGRNSISKPLFDSAGNKGRKKKENQCLEKKLFG